MLNTSTAYPCTIDYRKLIMGQLKADGVELGDQNINEENFPEVGEGGKDLVFEWVNQGKDMKLQDVLLEMKNRGLRPATFLEMVVFMSKHKENKTDCICVALGSRWHNPRYQVLYVPLLTLEDSSRSVTLDWIDRHWYPWYYFLGVRI